MKQVRDTNREPGLPVVRQLNREERDPQDFLLSLMAVNEKHNKDTTYIK